MRFTDVQQKEVIDVRSGKFIGFIVDAEVNAETGYIVAFHISPPKKMGGFFSGESQILKVHINHIISFGKDVILVQMHDW